MKVAKAEPGRTVYVTQSKAPTSLTKRVLDVAVSLVGLLALFPLLLLIAACIKLTSKGSVFFRQQRPGLRGVSFRLFKFRTMPDLRDANGVPLQGQQCPTRFGRLLRSTSLDELPELFNVLKGEMSLVGPRPLLMQYLDRYSPEQNRRHEVKPGITGWAQVNGRNLISWEQKFALDTWYVDHHSFWLDWWIILLTVRKVLRREGITPREREVVEEFGK